MKKVTDVILNYSQFLDLNFLNISNLVNGKNWDDEYEQKKYLEIFFQANWEILVELLVCAENEVLEYYDSGADLFPESYRVINPEKVANTKIIISATKRIFDFLSMTDIHIENLEFLKFVSFSNGNYFDEPPFNYIICEDSLGEKYVFNKFSVDYFHLNFSK